MKLKYRIWNETENRYLTPDEATVTADGKIVGWDGAKDDCVVEVWTGMVDAKGVEIYEGDVLKSPYGEVAVVWDEEGLCWDMKNKGARVRTALGFVSSSQVTVIGNIHEGVK